MAKRRKRRQRLHVVNQPQMPTIPRTKKKTNLTPLNPKARYQLAIESGKEVEAILRSKSSTSAFPKNSVGRFLHQKSATPLSAIYNYYARPEIQQEMFRYAAGRQITHLKRFQPQYERLVQPQDILPLTLNTLFDHGQYWPSLHGTISRPKREGKGRFCDVVIELDYKSSWKTCFELTRPVVQMFKERGAVFRLKFSGHCSVHIIIPGEVVQVDGVLLDHGRFFRCLSDLVKKEIKQSRYLDTSFHLPRHFLRLAYSLNENTGLVSLPFNLKDYDYFNPEMARPERVTPLSNWWTIPSDASGQIREFIEYVTYGKIPLSSKKLRVGALPAAGANDRWRPDAKLAQRARRQKREVLKQFLPNEGFYDKMLRIGQDAIDLREFLLLEDESSKVALRTLRRLHERDEKINMASIAVRFGVDVEDLGLLRQWESNEKALRYYAQEEIKQAIYAHAEGRKIRVGSEEKLVFLQEPTDLLPLIVYAQLCSDRPKNLFPTIAATNSKYERTGEVAIACDLKIEFSTRSRDENVFEAATPVIALLAGAGIACLLWFDGVMGLNLVVPYDGFPQVARFPANRHETILTQLSPYLKTSMRMPGAACKLIKDSHVLSPIPYVLHPHTGLACIPIDLSEFHTFDESGAWLENVQVDNEWWSVSEDAAAQMVKFLEHTVLMD